jgi:hypothetical protein
MKGSLLPITRMVSPLALFLPTVPTSMGVPLSIVFLQTSMDLLSLSLRMVGVERYSIEMIKEWGSGIVLRMVQCLGLFSSQTIAIRMSNLPAVLAILMEQDGLVWTREISSA